MAGNGDAAGRVADGLRRAGMQAEVTPSQANLEDVFVAATRGRPDQDGQERAA